MEKAMTQTEIEVQNFFARTDLDFIKCPLCKRPLLASACTEKQKANPPSKVNGKVYPHPNMGLCVAANCKHYVPDGDLAAHGFHRTQIHKTMMGVTPRLDAETLERIHKLKRIAVAARPLLHWE